MDASNAENTSKRADQSELLAALVGVVAVGIPLTVGVLVIVGALALLIAHERGVAVSDLSTMGTSSASFYIISILAGLIGASICTTTAKTARQMFKLRARFQDEVNPTKSRQQESSPVEGDFDMGDDEHPMNGSGRLGTEKGDR